MMIRLSRLLATMCGRRGEVDGVLSGDFGNRKRRRPFPLVSREDVRLFYG